MSNENSEIIDDGKNRRITIGSSWEEFDQEMTFYVSEEDKRTSLYMLILKNMVDGGNMMGAEITFTPDDTFDLTDDAIDKLLKE